MRAFKEVSRAFKFFFKMTLIISVSFITTSYLLAMLLGPKLFFFEPLSTQYSPNSLILGFPIILFAIIFGIPVNVSFGLVFLFFWSIYLLCFVVAWKLRESFHKVIRNSLSRPFGHLFKNCLFALPVIASMTLMAVVAISLFQESHGVPTGEPPISGDSLVAFLELTISPLIEEIGFRITPMGTFLIFYLLTVGKAGRTLTNSGLRLKLFFLTFLYPEKAKKILGLRTVDDSGIRKGISLAEWILIFLTSAVFGLAHYLYGGTWEIGKITSTFVQGFAMGFTYLLYGVQAPILLHWFFNYYTYTYSLASEIYPSIFAFYPLLDIVILILGILGWLAITGLGVRKLVKVILGKLSRPETKELNG